MLVDVDFAMCFEWQLIFIDNPLDLMKVVLAFGLLTNAGKRNVS